MAIDIKVIPTLRGEEAARFVKRAEEVMNNNNRKYSVNAVLCA